ncbi:TPA: class Ib ribonucleoside-diphosphate reductase assembly flavoprotein NrdI [Bacillus cereus]|nr:class Ib ribonucleoside-diphosphate reductase assembly flavoprotein NrdI [Bacillus cereus]HDR8329617.1 class Ib ribonucleoside-diphosphate reductase assembly flavoprotein NrdI [Bacillus cereus]HDR8336307.1 class Ib ribonucleoside-diphosphate reductase assembly flavoprotein NrdI [Bacillus cereus]
MDLVYDSMTGNVKRFANKFNELPFNIKPINSISRIENEFILLTYTTGIAQIPPTTKEFLETHKSLLPEMCLGVVSSGNRNWGSNFAASGDKIEAEYHIELLHKIEMAGSQKDVVLIAQKVNIICSENSFHKFRTTPTNMFPRKIETILS